MYLQISNTDLRRGLASCLAAGILSVSSLTLIAKMAVATPAHPEINSYIQQLQDPQHRSQAIESLSKLGQSAIPELIQLLQTRKGVLDMSGPQEPASPASAAVEALVKIGKPAIPALINAFTQNQTYTSLGAIDALSQIVKGDASALKVVIPRLWDDDARIRLGVFISLNDDSLQSEIQTAIQKALQSRNQRIQKIASFYQALIVQESRKEAVPELKNALKDEDAVIRLTAAVSLLPAKAELKSVIPVLLESLQEKDSMIRLTAIMSGIAELERLKLSAREYPSHEYTQIYTAIITAIADADQGVRETAIMATVGNNPHYTSAIPALIAALDDPDKNIRGMAVFSLSDKGVAAKAALAKIVKVLEDKEDTIVNRSNAALALADIGMEPKSATPILIGVFTDPSNHKHLRVSAALALNKIDPNVLISPLVQSLTDREIGVVAANFLSNIAVNMQSGKNQLSNIQLSQAISQFEQALVMISQSDLQFNRDKIKSLQNSVEALKKSRINPKS